jgi:TPR repeat protein
MYSMEQGVKRDHAKAAEWYLIAAEQGSSNAQFVLGVMYLFGNGVTQGFAKAYYLLGLANSCTHDTKSKTTISHALDNAAPGLNSAQLENERERWAIGSLHTGVSDGGAKSLMSGKNDAKTFCRIE